MQWYYPFCIPSKAGSMVVVVHIPPPHPLFGLTCACLLPMVHAKVRLQGACTTQGIAAVEALTLLLQAPTWASVLGTSPSLAFKGRGLGSVSLVWSARGMWEWGFCLDYLLALSFWYVAMLGYCCMLAVVVTGLS